MTDNVPRLDPATQVQASESLRRALKRLVIHTRPWTEDGRGETPAGGDGKPGGRGALPEESPGGRAL